MVATTLRKLLGVAVGFLILIKLSLDTVEYDMQNYGDRLMSFTSKSSDRIFERNAFERSVGLNKTSILGYLSRLLSLLLLIA